LGGGDKIVLSPHLMELHDLITRSVLVPAMNHHEH
jgi:hypothetical protein